MPHSTPLLISSVAIARVVTNSSTSKGKIKVNLKNLNSPLNLHKKLERLIICIPKDCNE